MANTTTSAGYTNILRVDLNTILGENQRAVTLEPPKIYALYSCTGNDNISDEVQLPYFKEPEAKSYNLDDVNVSMPIPNSGANFVLNKVEKYVMEADENVLQPHRSAPSEKWQTKSKNKVKVFLCQRGILTDIMTIPYCLENKQYCYMTFYVTKYCGIFHMRDVIWKPAEHEQQYPRKFWHLCFSDNPDSTATSDIPVNDLVYGIYKTVMTDFHLIYSAKIGGVKSKHKISDIHNMHKINKLEFIETKLINESRINGDPLHPRCFLWYLQAYLGNIKHFCVGVLDQNHIVHPPVQIKAVKDIAKANNWQPDVSARYLHTILKLIENHMSNVDCPNTVYEFRYFSTEGFFKLKRHIGKTEHSFLSDDYIKKCKQYTAE